MTLRNYDGDGRQGERQKSNINRFNEQNNNSARASRFFVHFFAVPAQILSVLENKKGEAINSTISVRTRARSPLLQPANRRRISGRRFSRRLKL